MAVSPASLKSPSHVPEVPRSSPPLLPADQELAPYNVIVVALEEDPTIRFVGNLVAGPDGEINEVDPAAIAIGDPVHVVFHQVEDVTLPRWVKT